MDNGAVGYLDDNPEFHHQLLLVRGNTLWLVLDLDECGAACGGSWHGGRRQQALANRRSR